MVNFRVSRRINLLRFRRLLAAVLLIVTAAVSTLYAQQNPAASAPAATTPPVVDPSLYSAMRWRLIGPYRAGRVTAVAGVPGDATTYYMGTPGGGVWKTTRRRHRLEAHLR